MHAAVEEPPDPLGQGVHVVLGQQREQAVAARRRLEGASEALRGAARSSSTIGSPAQPQSTVRSFGVGEKVTPWSMAQRRPSRSRRQCEPLRSELLRAASSTASERTSSAPECTTVTAEPPGVSPSKTARQPGRRAALGDEVHDDVVGHGVERVTDPQLHRARTERPVAQHGRRHDVPAAELGDDGGCDLASGERAVGEVPQRALAPHRLVDDVAARDASRPRDDREVGGLGDAPQDLELAGQVDRRRAVGSALVAIGPRADVARGVEWVAAERARGPTGGDEGVAAAREGAGLGRRQGDADRVAPERTHLVGRRVVDLVGVVVVALDDELLAVLVPREREGLHVPVLVERRLQRVGVLRYTAGLAGFDRGRPARAGRARR